VKYAGNTLTIKKTTIYKIGLTNESSWGVAANKKMETKRGCTLFLAIQRAK
jgi:hypothetical protein